MITRFSLDYDKNSSKIGGEPWHNLDTVVVCYSRGHKKLNKCK